MEFRDSFYRFLREKFCGFKLFSGDNQINISYKGKDYTISVGLLDNKYSFVNIETDSNNNRKVYLNLENMIYPGFLEVSFNGDSRVKKMRILFNRQLLKDDVDFVWNLLREFIRAVS